MPIHLRAEPGSYAPAVLCPGDPRRAEYVAKTFFDDPVLVNEERGMLGFTGTFLGTPLSVQSTGMGCPSAAIVFEELIQLGAQRLIRIGTCGGLQPGMAFADTVVAMAAGFLFSMLDSLAMPSLLAVFWQFLVTTLLFPFAHRLIDRFEDADVRFR